MKSDQQKDKQVTNDQAATLFVQLNQQICTDRLPTSYSKEWSELPSYAAARSQFLSILLVLQREVRQSIAGAGWRLGGRPG